MELFLFIFRKFRTHETENHVKVIFGKIPRLGVSENVWEVDDHGL